MSKNLPVKFSAPPILLAAWPGQGSVGIMAVDYLKYQLKAVPLSCLDTSSLISPDMVPVQNGVMQTPILPRSEFFISENPGIIFFESDVRLQGRENIIMIEEILKTAIQFKVTHIFTVASAPLPMSFKSPSRLYFSCSNQGFAEEFLTYGVEPMTSGILTGSEGLLPQLAGKKGIKGACILAGIPPYASVLPYPSASLDIMNLYMSMFNFKVDTSEIENLISRMGTMYQQAESQSASVTSNAGDNSEEDDLPQILPETAEGLSKDTPAFIFEKIEKLFAEAVKDISRAPVLKKELDKWELFSKYEARFLELFKKSDK